MEAEPAQLAAVVSLTVDLEAEGFEPVLVGGMALVVLGSHRVTRDFDFLVSATGNEADTLVRVVYRHGLRLVTKFGPQGEPVRSIDNVRVAVARVKANSPRSIFFHDRKTGLRVDFLFDFPLPAGAIAARATVMRTKSGRLRVATPGDLVRLKESAHANRKAAADAQDLEFLRHLSGQS